MKSYYFCRGAFIRLLFLLFNLCLFTPVLADNTIKLESNQFDSLGIVLGHASITTEIPILTAPAKVTIPTNQDYMISSTQAGLITVLTAAVGDSVNKGDIVARINSPELINLQKHYLTALNQLRLARINYQRDKTLSAEGIIAQRREQESLSLYNAAIFAETEAKQLLSIAGLSPSAIKALAISQHLSAELIIHTPISGAIIERHVTVGSRVDSATPLYRVANLHSLWLDISVPQEFSNELIIGDKVLVENTDIRGKISLLGESIQAETQSFRGNITLLGQSINPDDQTLLARAVITSTKQGATQLRAGENCTVQIMRNSPQPIFTVPNTAIAQHEAKHFIFVRNKAGFIIQSITIIGKQGDNSIIRAEIKARDELAIKGAVALKATWLGSGSYE